MQHILTIIFALTLLIAGCEKSHVSEPATAPSTVTSPTFPPTNPSAIGSLGLPLGTVAEIRATIVSGGDLRMKLYASSYLLSVTHVDNQPLPEPALLEFVVPAFIRVDLANDNFDLYELKHGENVGRLDSDQIQELEKDYVGKQVRLAVYETGGYSGIPDNLPADVPIWQDHNFTFSTWLIVLAER